MLKKICVVSAACLFAFVASVLVLNQNLLAGDAGPDTVTIESKLWEAPKYQPVQFTHKKHTVDYKIQCTECHHIYKGGQNVWKQGDPVQKCDACHTCAKTGKALKDATPEEQKLSLFNAYHGSKGNCVGCHKDIKKKDPAKNAPTSCTGCHARK